MAIVDLLIPAYNGADTVRQTIESVQAQTLTDWRMVIVDDGSTDATGAILAEMSAADPRIHVHTKPNGGIVEALNTGLALCTADIVARLDADDLCYPDRLRYQVDHLATHPGTIGIGAGVRHIDIDGEPLGTTAVLSPIEHADPWFVPSAEPYLIHPFFTARRSALNAVGGYRQVHYAEDTDLYWRLSDLGELHNPQIILGDYRFHANSLSSMSIVNGRIMAISSQLCGISEQRRRRGVPDFAYTKESLAEYKRVKTLAAMFAVAAEPLDPIERAYFAAAIAAKLLELTAYRPYELEASDCDFIGQLARGDLRVLSSDNRRQMQRRITGAAARIAAAGRMPDALRMVPLKMYPSFAPRYLLRTAIPQPLRKHFRRGDTNTSPFK